MASPTPYSVSATFANLFVDEPASRLYSPLQILSRPSSSLQKQSSQDSVASKSIISPNTVNRPNPQIKNNRTLNCLCEAANFYDITDLMDTFVGKGTLAGYKPFIEGFDTLHFMRKEFAITFKPDTNTGLSSKLSEFHAKFHAGKVVVNNNGSKFTLRTKMPNPVTTLVTLYPVPIEMTDRALEDMLAGTRWGVCTAIQRGVYDEHPEWKNGYVHVCIEDIQRSNIPNFIIVGNKRVFISVHEESTPDIEESLFTQDKVDETQLASASGGRKTHRRRLSKRKAGLTASHSNASTSVRDRSSSSSAHS